MSVKIRLARYGKTHAPIYRIVAMDSRKKRDGKFLDNLGTYNPITGEFIQFHVDRINEWIEKGAQESDTVRKLHKEFIRRGKEAVKKAAPKKVAPEAPAEEAKAEA